MQLKVAEFKIRLADHLRIQRFLGLKFIQKCVNLNCEVNCCFFLKMSILKTLPDHCEHFDERVDGHAREALFDKHKHFLVDRI